MPCIYIEILKRLQNETLVNPTPNTCIHYSRFSYLGVHQHVHCTIAITNNDNNTSNSNNTTTTTTTNNNKHNNNNTHGSSTITASEVCAVVSIWVSTTHARLSLLYQHTRRYSNVSYHTPSYHCLYRIMCIPFSLYHVGGEKGRHVS